MFGWLMMDRTSTHINNIHVITIRNKYKYIYTNGCCIWRANLNSPIKILRIKFGKKAMYILLYKTQK